MSNRAALGRRENRGEKFGTQAAPELELKAAELTASSSPMVEVVVNNDELTANFEAKDTEEKSDSAANFALEPKLEGEEIQRETAIDEAKGLSSSRKIAKMKAKREIQKDKAKLQSNLRTKHSLNSREDNTDTQSPTEPKSATRPNIKTTSNSSASSESKHTAPKTYLDLPDKLRQRILLQTYDPSDLYFPPDALDEDDFRAWRLLFEMRCERV
jgi:hypothetical protein